jgi:hypothetical protein
MSMPAGYIEKALFLKFQHEPALLLHSIHHMPGLHPPMALPLSSLNQQVTYLHC